MGFPDTAIKVIMRLCMLFTGLVPIGCLENPSIGRLNGKCDSGVLAFTPLAVGSCTNQRKVPWSWRNRAHGRDDASDAKDNGEILIRDILKHFQGEFDNYNQVVEDRARGMTAGPGGGHEHIHCTLKIIDDRLVPRQIAEQDRRRGRSSGTDGVSEAGDGAPQPPAVVVAKYFFNGDPSVVFRYRLYSFHECPPDAEGSRGPVIMRLWRLLPSVERRLRTARYDLVGFDWRTSENGDSDSDSDSDSGRGDKEKADENVAEFMVGCEIYWSRGWSGTGTGEDTERTPDFVGLMGKDDEGTWIASQMTEGVNILVKDDLKLWPDEIWVNDRGFDASGNFVYGNQRGVPYKLERVTPGGALGWTLGEENRSLGLYEEKMRVIGVTPGPPVRSG